MICRKDEDLRQMADWEYAETPQDVDIDLLVERLTDTFERCEGTCDSRKNCGEDACYCVRACFPSPEVYEVYKALKEDSARIAALAILSKVIRQ